MSYSSKIEWTETTWNPIAGCSPVSEGCRNCYAAKEAIRLAGNPHDQVRSKYEGTAEMRGVGPNRRAVFTGRINYAGYRTMDAPLRWRKPRLVFVNSMSDLFHEDVSDEIVDQVFGVMSLTPRHTYQVLTKRPERMPDVLARIAANHTCRDGSGWPLKNVWLGTSVEDQAAADERIPHLLQTPATVRFLSCEPLLGQVDVSQYLRLCRRDLVTDEGGQYSETRHEAANQMKVFSRREAWALHWVVAGGESGPGARSAHPDWFRALRDQCEAAAVPFFFKQWGAWAPFVDNGPLPENCVYVGCDGTVREWFEADDECMGRVGKKTAGRELDGRIHAAIPSPVPDLVA